jgi:hypothetical protein
MLENDPEQSRLFCCEGPGEKQLMKREDEEAP